MAWTFHETYGISDDGATIQRTDDGWDAFPFGPESGAVGTFADRDRAAAVASAVLAGSNCCHDDGDPTP